MMDQADWILLATSVVLGILVLSLVVAVVTENTEYPCNEYANDKVQNLPVRCLEYYGLTRGK